MKSYNTLTKNTLITIDTLINLNGHIKYKNIYNIPNKKNIYNNVIQIIESEECKSFFQKKIIEIL